MNLKEMKDLCFNMIDELDFDEQIDAIVFGAINEAYRILSDKDKRIATAYLPAIQGKVTLPINTISVIQTEPSLLDNDKVVGNTLYTNNVGVLKIDYTYAREPLVNDTDEPDLAESLVPALSVYACYKYYTHRKKIDVANSFYSNFANIVNMYNPAHRPVRESVIMDY